jgi:hypothetical protein
VELDEEEEGLKEGRTQQLWEAISEFDLCLWVVLCVRSMRWGFSGEQEQQLWHLLQRRRRRCRSRLPR